MDGNPEPSQQGHVYQAATNSNDVPVDILAIAAEINGKENSGLCEQLYADGDQISRSTEDVALSRTTTSNTLVSGTVINELDAIEESINKDIRTGENKENNDGENIDDIVGDTVTIEVADVDNATRDNKDGQEPVENYQENPNKDLGMANRDEIEDADNTAAIQLVNTPVPGEQDIANTDDLIVKD
eukprot:858459_1